MVLDVPRFSWESELARLLDVVKTSGRPATFTFGVGNEGPADWNSTLAIVDKANAEGAAVTAQVLPRPVGIIAGFELTIHPFCQLPSYQPLAKLPFVEKIAALQQPEMRAKLISEKPPEGMSLATVGRLWEWMFPFGDPPNYEPARETSVAAQARAKGVPPEEVAYDLMNGQWR